MQVVILVSFFNDCFVSKLNWIGFKKKKEPEYMVKQGIFLIVLCMIIPISAAASQRIRNDNLGGRYIGFLVGPSEEDEETGEMIANSFVGEVGVKVDSPNSNAGISLSLAAIEIGDRAYDGLQTSINLNTHSWPLQASVGLGLMWMEYHGGVCDKVYNSQTKQYEDSYENCTGDSFTMGVYPELDVRVKLIPKVFFGFYARQYYIDSVSEGVRGLYFGITF